MKLRYCLTDIDWMEINLRKTFCKLAEFRNRLGTSDKSADLIMKFMTGQNGGIF
jgi:hypothetical protein